MTRHSLAQADGRLHLATSDSDVFHDLREAIAGKQVDRARDIFLRLDEASRRRPQCKLLEARLLLLEERFPEAEAACRAVLEKWRDSEPALVVLCRVLLRQGRGKEARELFARSIWTSKMLPEQKAKLLTQVTAAGVASEITAFLESLERGETLGAMELSRVAIAEDRLGFTERAAGRLLALERREGSLTKAQASQLIGLLLKLDRLDEARARALQLAASAEPQWLHRLAQLAALEGDDDAAAGYVAQGLERAPADFRLLKQFVTLRIPPDRIEALFGIIEAGRRTAKFGALSLWHYALAALHARKTEVALSALAEIGADVRGTAAMAASLRATLMLLPSEAWTGIARFRNDPTEDTQIVNVPQARATIIVFPSLLNMFGMLPFDYADALFATVPANIVYLRDPRQSSFLEDSGVLGEGQNDMAERLRRLNSELGGLPVVTVGTSGGGFAAFRVGALLEARAAISFSGPTKVFSTEDRPEISQRRLGLMSMSEYSDRQRDVLPDVAAAQSTRFIHFAGAENAEDQFQQERLRGLANVETELVPGCSQHNTLLPFVAAGRFHTLVMNAIVERE